LAGPVLQRAFLELKAEFKASDMAFGIVAAKDIRLANVIPRSWELIHDGRTLLLAGDPATDYADALPDLARAVRLSAGLATLKTDLFDQ
jgi:uncharacterized protein YbjT (DUF2867 family)